MILFFRDSDAKSQTKSFIPTTLVFGALHNPSSFLALGVLMSFAWLGAWSGHYLSTLHNSLFLTAISFLDFLVAHVGRACLQAANIEIILLGEKSKLI